jgi:hypothetical protein
MMNVIEMRHCHVMFIINLHEYYVLQTYIFMRKSVHFNNIVSKAKMKTSFLGCKGVFTNVSEESAVFCTPEDKAGRGETLRKCG